jgi:hypothetical protein
MIPEKSNEVKKNKFDSRKEHHSLNRNCFPHHDYRPYCNPDKILNLHRFGNDVFGNPFDIFSTHSSSNSKPPQESEEGNLKNFESAFKCENIKAEIKEEDSKKVKSKEDNCKEENFKGNKEEDSKKRV